MGSSPTTSTGESGCGYEDAMLDSKHACFRDQVRQLRRRGRSINEIAAHLGMAKSSVSYMVRGIHLTREQRNRLLQKEKRNRKRLSRWSRREARRDPAGFRRRQRKSAKAWWTGLTPAQRAAVCDRIRAACLARHKMDPPRRTPRTLDRRTYRLCLRVAPMLGYHPNWNYIMSRGLGYLAVLCPDHPRCTPRGYVPVHRIVMECKLGRLLAATEIVHHVGGETGDNSAGNLACTTFSAHSRIHARPVTWWELTCGWCGKLFRRCAQRYHSTKSGLHFCSRSCGANLRQAEVRKART